VPNKNLIARDRQKKTDARKKRRKKDDFFRMQKMTPQEKKQEKEIAKRIEEKVLRRRKFTPGTYRPAVDPPPLQITKLIRAVDLPMITLNGMVYTNDSFSIVTRGLASGFSKLGYKVAIDAWAEGNTSIPIEDEVGKCIKQDSNREIGIRISHPDSFSALGSYKFRIGYGVCETDTIKEDWVKICNRYCHQVWTPSTFSSNTFKRAGIENVHTVPNGFNSEYFNKRVPPYPYKFPKGTFIFLTIGNAQERKGTDLLYKTFRKEFGRDEPVVLVIKSYAPWAWGLSHYAGNEMMTPKLAEKHNVKLIKDPQVYGFGKVEESWNYRDKRWDLGLSDPNIPYNKMAGLYTGAKCFVLPTKGEGFGLPILEAKACGIPVITTNHSGHLDFCDNKDTYLLEHTGFTKAFEQHAWQGYWVEPDPEHLRYLMRYVYENYEMALRKAEVAYEKVHKKWTWVQAARKGIASISLNKPEAWIDEIIG